MECGLVAREMKIKGLSGERLCLFRGLQARVPDNAAEEF